VRNSFNAWTPTGTILIARNKNKQANIQFVEEEKPDTVYFLFKDEQVGRFSHRPFGNLQMQGHHFLKH
jgi:hypothetical protein